MKPRPSLLARALGPRFERRVVVLAPGGRRGYRAAEWRDAIVLIESGQIQLELAGRPPRRFRRGDLLWLGGLGLRAIYNHGSRPAVLIAVCRAPDPRMRRSS